MADARLKSFIDRVLRLKEEQDALAADIREVYAEAKGEGFDKTAMGQLVAYLRKREKDCDKLAEQSAIFDLYLEAYERPSHAHTREDRSYSQSGLSYAEEKGRGDIGIPISETGELTDNQESEPCLGHATEHSAYVGTAPDENPTQDDVGATASSTNSAHKPAGDLAADKGDKDRGSFPVGGPAHSNPQVPSPRPAASTGEAMSSSQAQASPATVSDLPISTTPSFSGRVTGDMPDIPAFLDRRQPKAREWEDA